MMCSEDLTFIVGWIKKLLPSAFRDRGQYMQRHPLSFWRYSPLMLGISGSLGAGLFLLGAMAVADSPIPMAWRITLLIFPIVSLVLHVASTRVLFVRISDRIGVSLILVAAIA